MVELRGLPLIDDHVHVFGPEAAAVDFDPLRTVTLGGSDPEFLETDNHQVTEAEQAHLARQLESTLGYHHAIHSLARFLGCDATREAVVAARARECENFGEYVARLYRDIGLELSLIDVGLGAVDLDEFGRRAGVPCKGIYRIEPLLVTLWDSHDNLDELDRAFVDVLSGELASGRHVAMKSIIAYRTGLGVERPADSAVRRSFEALKRSPQGANAVRQIKPPAEVVADVKVLRDHWVWRALELSVELNVPFQIHTGVGDQDLDINASRPGLLAPVFRDARLRHARIVLLHGAYPFHEEAACLVDVFPNVYLDLSEHNLFLGPAVVGVLRDVLAIAPFNKLIFGSDAYRSPDLQWIAARATIDALSVVLEELLIAGSIDRGAAVAAAARILSENARELYGL